MVSLELSQGVEPNPRDFRRRLDVYVSSAHELMLALMDFAAAQTVDPGCAADRVADMGTCQTCTHETRQCVRGFYFKGLRDDCDDESEIARLRTQGCHVQVVEADRLETLSPELFAAIKRAIKAASR
jgi:hypothetical protein